MSADGPRKPKRSNAPASGPHGLHPQRPTPRLYDCLLSRLRAANLDQSTQDAYIAWLRRYLEFHNHQHPAHLNQKNVAEFLRSLGKEKLKYSEQHQALTAVLFLYRDVLPGSFSWLTAFAPTESGLKSASGRTLRRSGQKDRAQQGPARMLASPDMDTMLDRVRHAIRLRHLALKTEHAYVNWTRRFILFHNKRSPIDLGKTEVSAFLTHLAVNGNVAASTQNQALAAILFLYRNVLERDFGWLDDVVRAKKPKRIPVVFCAEEAELIIDALTGVWWLIAKILYGGGLRIAECLRLRVKDLDFERLEITVRDGKGAKDRVTLLPETVVESLQEHLKRVRQQHETAMKAGYGGVQLPFALARKYPNAQFEWGWQYVFPAPRPSRDPRSGAYRRHHLDESGMQKAIRAALRKLGINKPAGCHTFRHYADSRIMPTEVWLSRFLAVHLEFSSIADAA